MPGATQKFALPYALPTEHPGIIRNVTQLLAERLETLINGGELNGDPGQEGPPGGPNGPAVSVTGASQAIPSGQLYYWTSSQTTEFDLRSAGGSQVWANGVVPSRDGIYQVNVTVPWAVTNATSNTVGDRALKLIDAETGNALAEDVRRGSTGNGMELISHLSAVLPLKAGQQLTAYLFQTSGATLTAGGVQQGAIRTRMSCIYLGPST